MQTLSQSMKPEIYFLVPDFDSEVSKIISHYDDINEAIELAEKKLVGIVRSTGIEFTDTEPFCANEFNISEGSRSSNGIATNAVHHGTVPFYLTVTINGGLRGTTARSSRVNHEESVSMMSIDKRIKVIERLPEFMNAYFDFILNSEKVQELSEAAQKANKLRNMCV